MSPNKSPQCMSTKINSALVEPTNNKMSVRSRGRPRARELGSETKLLFVVVVVVVVSCRRRERSGPKKEVEDEVPEPARST